MIIVNLIFFLPIIKRKKIKETAKNHRKFDNVVGTTILTAIVSQYNDYADETGCPLNEDEKMFVKSLYTTHEDTRGSTIRRSTYVSV